MRAISKAELGTSWVYWGCALVFLVMMGVGVWLVFDDNGKERSVGIAVALVGFTFGVGAVAWPLLRKREAQGIDTELIRNAETHCDAIIFPASKVKYYVTVIGSFMLTLGSVGLMISAESIENQIKAGLASAVWFFVFGLCLWSSRHGRFGVVILSEGLIWREMFRAPYFIPWSVVASSGIFRKREKNVPKPILSFGILVSDPNLVRTTKWARKKMLAAQKETGWHLYFFAETIAAPLALLATVVDYYHKHSESRSELANGRGVNRVDELDRSLVETPMLY